MSAPSPNLPKQHIECRPDVFAGKPCIAGSRIRVQDIYIWHELMGESVDEIVANFPQLTHADVYAALTYLWDHRDETVAEVRRNEQLVEQIKARHRSKLDPRTATGS